MKGAYERELRGCHKVIFSQIIVTIDHHLGCNEPLTIQLFVIAFDQNEGKLVVVVLLLHSVIVILTNRKESEPNMTSYQYLVDNCLNGIVI